MFEYQLNLPTKLNFKFLPEYPFSSKSKNFYILIHHSESAIFIPEFWVKIWAQQPRLPLSIYFPLDQINFVHFGSPIVSVILNT